MSDFNINNPYETDPSTDEPVDAIDSVAESDADELSAGDRFIRLDNSDSSDTSIYDKLSDPRFDPESAKIAAEAAIGTLDDNVDITDPDYDEAKAEAIESKL